MNTSTVIKGVALASFSAQWALAAIGSTSKNPAQREAARKMMESATEGIKATLKG